MNTSRGVSDSWSREWWTFNTMGSYEGCKRLCRGHHWRSILLNHTFSHCLTSQIPGRDPIDFIWQFFPPRFVSCAFSSQWVLIKEWLLSYFAGTVQPRAASVAVTQWSRQASWANVLILSSFSRKKTKNTKQNKTFLTHKRLHKLAQSSTVPRERSRDTFYLSIEKYNQGCIPSELCYKIYLWRGHGENCVREILNIIIITGEYKVRFRELEESGHYYWVC